MGKTRDELNELTAQAMHKDKGYDLEACRTDALMKQALWSPTHFAEAVIQFLEEKYDEKDPLEKGIVSPDDQTPPATTTNGSN